MLLSCDGPALLQANADRCQDAQSAKGAKKGAALDPPG